MQITLKCWNHHHKMFWFSPPKKTWRYLSIVTTSIRLEEEGGRGPIRELGYIWHPGVLFPACWRSFSLSHSWSAALFSRAVLWVKPGLDHGSLTLDPVTGRPTQMQAQDTIGPLWAETSMNSTEAAWPYKSLARWLSLLWQLNFKMKSDGLSTCGCWLL